MRPRRITDKQIAYVVDVTTRRREAMRKVSEFPTNAQLADELGFCQRVIDRISAGGYVPRGTSFSPTQLDEYAAKVLRE